MSWLFWIFVVQSICCFRYSLPANTFTYTYFSASDIKSGTPQSSGSTATKFNNATKLVVDSSNNVYYIADSGNHVIKKVPTSTGIPVVVAGTLGQAGYSGDLGLATNALLNTPMDVSYDSSSNIYIADTNNHVIRVVWAYSGFIQTLVGTGASGSTCTSSTSVATSCTLNSPQGIYSTPGSILYIADTGNHCIRKLSINYVYGTPTLSPSTTNSPVANAPTMSPAVAPVFQGVFWGQNGVPGVTGDNSVASGSNVKFNNPKCIANWQGDKSFWICDNESRIRRISYVSSTKTYYITTIAGSVTPGSTGDGGLALNALLNNPTQISCVGGSTSWTLCYFADTNNHRIRVLQNFTTSPGGVSITTLVGTGTAGYSTGNGTLLSISFLHLVHVLTYLQEFLRNVIH